MKTYEIGQTIRFKLDNYWDGVGIIKCLFQRSVEVDLLQHCKEFDAGVMIIVGKDEIID